MTLAAVSVVGSTGSVDYTPYQWVLIVSGAARTACPILLSP